jgi:hypothetical protein
MTPDIKFPPHYVEFHSSTLPSSTREGERIESHEFPRGDFKAGTQEAVERGNSLVQKKGSKKEGAYKTYRE